MLLLLLDSSLLMLLVCAKWIGEEEEGEDQSVDADGSQKDPMLN